MKLFHEVYGSYYHTVAEILRNTPLDSRSVQRVIEENAYAESVLFLVPELLGDWELLRKKGAQYESKLRAAPAPRPTTLLERRWLKAQLSDPRARLFLPDALIDMLEQELRDAAPLYEQHDFIYFDRYRDPDPFSHEGYIKNFREVLYCLRRHLALEISYIKAKGGEIKGLYMPLGIEYSGRDDKFRLYAAHCARPHILVTLNLSRILSVMRSDAGEFPKAGLDALLDARTAPKEAVLRVTDERKAVDRLLISFVDFDKQARQEDDAHWIVRISYSKDEEIELLIRLLSFGSMVELLSPEALRRKLAARVLGQDIPD